SKGVLYGFTNGGRLYTINTVTGAATQVGTTPITVNGKAKIDFNPVPDKLRVVTDQTQNLRVDPDLGTLINADPSLTDPGSGKTPVLIGNAYTNSFPGAKTTSLFGITADGNLVVQGSAGGAPNSPNGGVLTTIGATGLGAITGAAPMDFDGEANDGVFAANVNGMTQLYSINYLTGAATALGPIGTGNLQIVGLSIGNFGPGAASAQPDGAARTNAASFAANTIAPDSIAAVFGNFQTMNGQPAAASATPLPNSLNGISATVNGMAAPLFFVANNQINLGIPTASGLVDGKGTLVITNTDGSLITSTVTVQRAKAGIFTFAANGQGAPAG